MNEELKEYINKWFNKSALNYEAEDAKDDFYAAFDLGYEKGQAETLFFIAEILKEN